MPQHYTITILGNNEARVTNISHGYLEAFYGETFTRAIVQKAGRRVANLHVEAWQDSRTRPIAMLRGNFLMPGPGEG